MTFTRPSFFFRFRAIDVGDMFLMQDDGKREEAHHAEIAEKARLTAEKVAREKLEESVHEEEMHVDKGSEEGSDSN